MALNSEERDLIRAEVASALNRQNVDLAQQVERHRNFLQSQQRWLVTGITSIVVVTAVIVAWIFGDTLPNQIDDRIIQYRITDKLTPVFREHIRVLIEKLADTKKTDLNSQLDDLTNEAQTRLTDIVNERVLTAEARLQSQSDKLVESAIQELGEQNSQQLDATANTVSRLVLGQVREFSFTHPGMIVPFVGEISVAESLKDFGWEICDGRKITSKVALPEFRDIATPNLLNRFLKGSTTASKQSGSSAATTSAAGEHAHKMPERWYNRNFAEGRFNAIDTGGGAGVDGAQVQPSGWHEHTVSIEPPATSVIYLMRVR